MSTQVVRRRLQYKWIPVALVAGAALAGGFAYMATRPKASPIAKEASEVLTVPEGEAGKVGDLQVTEEALKLAEISIQPASARLVSEELTVSGTVQAGGDQLVKVTPRVAGRVVRVMVQSGDLVEAGQSLALIESTDLAQAQAMYRQAAAKSAAAAKNLERQQQLAKLGQFGRPQVEESRTKAVEADRDIHEAEHHLSEERTKLAEAESERQGLISKVDQAKAEMEVSRARLDRAEALFKEELISQQELERIRADHKKAIADVSVAEADLSQGDARIKGARSRVEAAEGELQLAKKRAGIIQQGLQREEQVYKGQFLTSREIVQAEAELNQARVEAQGAADAVRLLGGTLGGGNTLALTTPIAGRVQDRSITLGESIDPEHAAFTVVNLDEVWAQLAIAPQDLGSVRVRDQVVLTSEAAPGKTFMGVVLSIGTQADESTRSVAVRTTLENAEHLLRPGAYVRGHVVTDIRRERVTVPTAALQEHTGRPTVYIAKNTTGAFEVRHVKLGVAGTGWREVSEGLKPGERVAASGTFYLKSEALKDSLSDGCCAPGG
jgi:cobalt-zinc-cadmium efflux system membrane fusion protein